VGRLSHQAVSGGSGVWRCAESLALVAIWGQIGANMTALAAQPRPANKRQPWAYQRRPWRFDGFLREAEDRALPAGFPLFGHFPSANHLTADMNRLGCC
jgi:hypothetical protein